MTAKEKAKELVNKMWAGFQFTIDEYTAKQCALIACDEIIDNMPFGFYSGIRPNYKGSDLKFWQEVKKEINNL